VGELGSFSQESLATLGLELQPWRGVARPHVCCSFLVLGRYHNEEGLTNRSKQL
jgi:hypothetical protein